MAPCARGGVPGPPAVPPLQWQRQLSSGPCRAPGLRGAPSPGHRCLPVLLWAACLALHLALRLVW